MGVPATPTIGTRFADRYLVQGVLGQGGMGIVFAVKDEQTGTACALKLLNRPEVRVDAARVIREGRALMRISSQHVIRILDAGELPQASADGRATPYLVLERLDGKNLSELAGPGCTISWQRTVRYALETCDALAHVHALGIVHRDIKPSNLFLARTGAEDREGMIKVLDFGIAKLQSVGLGLSLSTLTTGTLGSPQFMSPEQIANPRIVDARTDLWSLGVVIFRLVTGRFPFVGANLGELSAAVLKASVPTLAECGIDSPPALQRVVDRCLARKLADRWSSAEEVAESLGWLAA